MTPDGSDFTTSREVGTAVLDIDVVEIFIECEDMYDRHHKTIK